MADTEWRQGPDGGWWFRGPDNQWHPSDVGPAAEAAGGPAGVSVEASVSPNTAGYPPPAPSPVGAWLGIVAGGLAAVASFLPWVHFTTGLVSVSRNGWQLGAGEGFSVDGAIVLGLGLVTVVIGIAKLTRSATPRYMQRSPIVTGIAIAALALLELPSIHTLIRNATSQDSYIVGSVGVGVWLAVAAGVIAIVAGLVLRSATLSNAIEA